MPKLRRKLLIADLGSTTQVQALLEQGRTEHYDPKQVICEEGDESDCLFIVLRGRIEFFLRRGKDGAQNIYLDEQGEGEYFGELGLIDSQPRSVSVMAKESTECRLVPKASFLAWLVANSDACIALLRHASARTRDLSADLRASAGSAYERVTGYLERAAVLENGSYIVHNMPNNTELGRRLGITREHIGNILSELMKGGYIEARGRNMLLKKKLPVRY